MLQQKSALQNTLYEQDFYAWTQQQIELLKTQNWQDLDLENVIEEIASLGRQQRQELRNRLSILLAHLLKWEFQSQKRSRSWLATIRIQRIDIMDLLIDNPSLKPYAAEAIARAYRKSISIAVQETDLPNQTFPRECPYLFDNILADDFYPGESSELIDE
ncbi:MAG: DUF29 domain-containing protein [Limnothrix sp.]